MRPVLALCLLLTVTTFTARNAWCAESGTAADTQGIEFFETRIRPVLIEHCYECHSSGKKRQGGLLLDSRVDSRAGGDSGTAIVPGSPEDSLLLSALRYESFEMPPRGRLPEHIIADFEKWIRMGAPDPRDRQSAGPEPSIDEILDRGRKYWSFQPIRKPELPAVSDEAWPKTPVDRFILARLDQAELTPARPAGRAELLRRLCFDLTGLPPTVDQLRAFLGDRSPDAYERTVDELLQSPHFGERWGRHWLDVVRFAESSGGGRTRIFDDAWRYRDYVIRSFNEGKPFDRFIREQLAGDLLDADSLPERRDNLTATSLLSIGPINYELQDKELLDMEVVDEQLDVVSKAFLGMTLGCARCHDHKFDPIPTRDYYALAGIFTSTRTLNHANVSNPVMRELPVDARTRQQIDAHAARVRPLQNQIKAIESRLKDLGGTPASDVRNRIPLASLSGQVLDETQARLSGAWMSSTSISGFVKDGYHFSRDETATAEYRFSISTPGKFEVRLSYTTASNRASNVTVQVRHAQDRLRTVSVNMRKKPPLDGHFVSLGTFDAEDSVVVSLSCRGADGVVIADSVQLLPAAAGEEPVSSFLKQDDGVGEPSPDTQELEALRSELASIRNRLKQLESQAPPSPPSVMSVEESDSPGDCRICIRGNVHNRGPVVPRGFLSVMTDQPAINIPDGTSGRRELADWIASRENTLTARVITNRVWYWLMGSGIVRTVDNFGTTGELPSHPKLLDWLADDFTTHGWSIRHVIRQIVLSRTYQLASQPDPVARQTDPGNRLFAFAPRRRLDAECLRDAILAISGQLDPACGGSTIKAGTRSEFGYEFNDPKFDGRRRSVYVPVFRNTLLDLFEVFDFADPNLPMGRRSVSTLPTQGLYFLNSPWVHLQARYAAERLLEPSDLSEAERIDLAHLRFLGRLPTPAERALAEEMLETSRDGDTPPVRSWTLICQALFGSIDFRYLR